MGTQPRSPIYLRTIREQRGLTQAQLVRLTDGEVAQNTISKLEARPDAMPAYTTHLALARALNVDPQRLRFGPDPRHAPRRRVGRRPKPDPAAVA